MEFSGLQRDGYKGEGKTRRLLGTDTPVKTGVQLFRDSKGGLDSGLRRNDKEKSLKTSFEHGKECLVFDDLRS